MEKITREEHVKGNSVEGEKVMEPWIIIKKKLFHSGYGNIIFSQ